MGNETRQRTDLIMVRVTLGEKTAIRAEANQYSLSSPAYLRTLGLGFSPTSTVDQQAITRFTKLHGDLGRVGGLLKLLLIKDPKTAELDFEHSPQALIVDLNALQREIRETIRRRLRRRLVR